ncbi:[protein-PII] uridylyltransferase [Thiohalomonas denitrificans]|uniref:Bifunctional uridylyltransferase/uridylyl-removing enzyme n=1 Tax=Thiohalomonas denitrificans TaxID=415747 RepID=A0A1G5Q314_9GAMM|nr:[protein-PII] uridylyltransferase [Thiohalomonas denitrificans]SCZ55781.1 UTP--GlnB (protein PII) uridylyltransferase, GlnD [Thiohalomonas denitrificans]
MSLALFDAEAFDSALAAGEPPLALFRDTARFARSALEQRFQAGDSVVELVTAHARFVDRLLKRAWGLHFREATDELCLVAVGGYGRGELHPHSDVDLMILAEPGAIRHFQSCLEGFLLFLWDIGLEVGHSVRTVEQCVEEAEADITVATNLMESRLLIGPRALYEAMRERTSQDHVWPGPAFFEAKWEEQIARHHKFNDTAYNLEPNVKEGPGGLRDIQMIGWVAKRHYGAETLHNLVGHGFLTASEYRALSDGQAFLWKVRFGLHILSGRREDRLLIDHQRTLATQFGFRDDETRLAVEHFMKEYYRTVMELERLNEMLLQLFQEEILYGDQPADPVPISKRFQLRKGFLETTSDRVFRRYPFALLELFLVLMQHPNAKGVRAETIRQIRNHLYLIDAEYRSDLRCRSLFMEILRQPQGITDALHRMNRYGVLGAYLPVFGRVAGQMQHDLFHVYTVDEHTLFVVRNLRRFAVPEHAGEFPLCSRLIQRIAKPELLYIAALFHDVAKGRGGDHSRLGAEDATAFCAHHLLSKYDTHLVAWLVRNHLLMSTTAQRKDISDPDIINEFAAQVGAQIRLEYLYLLTVADIRATSPGVWNSWKDALLAELYHAARKALRQGLTNPIVKEELIEETQREAIRLLEASDVDMNAVSRFWDRLTDDYFVRYSVDEIAWHSRAIAKKAEPDRPLVLLRRKRGGTEVFIFTRIREHQFTITTTALDQLGLTVADARIIPSRDGYTLDTYIVLEESGEPIEEPEREREIRERLTYLLAHPEETPPRVRRRVSRQLTHFNLPTQVTFQNDLRNGRTIMEVVAADRPGLLAEIGRALTECGVLLQDAKIATFGERVEDVFMVADKNGELLRDEQKTRCLRQRICERLDRD